MGYTMSFDASCKLSRSAVGGYLQHTARDVDKRNGREVRHSNEDIDPTRTGDNITRVYNAETGKYEDCKDSRQLLDALDKRLQSVKKPLRKDAVVLRPVILQLDPEWYAANQDEAARKKSYNRMLQWAGDTFGRENMIGFSLHQDETNPHIHVLVTPVTSDGRLSQKDWYSGPAALRQMHDGLREHMQKAGFDIEMRRKKPGKHAKRLSEGEYKDYAELEKQRAAVAAREQAVREQEEQLRVRNRLLIDRETEVGEREEAVEGRERAVEGRERAVKRMEVQVAGKLQEALKLADRASRDVAQQVRRGVADLGGYVKAPQQHDRSVGREFDGC